ncbi:MAG TPA: tail fiber domain-containing protein [Pyrinomonadaceae bacterium]|nr:tail fiber domain-containing protein [Pyrinomonadaceae bacterium]
MLINRLTTIAILVLMLVTTNVHAQTAAQTGPGSSVTGSVTPEGAVRMIAHGEVLQIRMEIYSAAGELVSDTGLRQGSVIDWKQTDAVQAMPDGAYLVVVTTKDFKGDQKQRMASLSLQGGQLQLQNQKREEVTTAQMQSMETRRGGKKIGMNDGDDTISVLREGKERAVVVTAHDGSDGQVSSTTGTLTFRTGNVFSGQEKEQLRITPEGRVGIGTKTPEATLDVAGTIKARGGIQFEDGTVLSSAKAVPEKDAPSAGGGNTPSGTNIITAINDPATAGVISDNRVSLNLARLGTANTWTNFNTFSAGLSANNTPITNVGNPVNGGDAVNKNYLDATAVKFVPAVQQLSVGDANGTAPMISLRGQSTCCGPTTGFADFKVFQNGSFVATGNLGIGVSPKQGPGYRTSWDTYKGAFRSGYADTEWDDAKVGFFSWAGGSNSTAEGLYALAFGDTNKALSTSSIAFGSGNEVKGAAGISAGAGNRVCDTYGVAFGNKAISGGPLINGACDPQTFNLHGLAAVAIGYNVTADQDHSFAFGKFASSNGFSGGFVWGDGLATSSTQTFKAIANNEFAARASGGFRFRTNLAGTTGCNLPAGSGVFNCTSSRATKENFQAVSGGDVLSRLKGIEVSTWNYISEGRSVRHMGPMAEDFFNAFRLGSGNTSIGLQDLTGVSLAAIKELHQRTDELQQKTTEVEQLREQVNQLRQANSEMERRLATIEQLLLGQAQQTAAQKLH